MNVELLDALEEAAKRAADTKLYGSSAVVAGMTFKSLATPKVVLELVNEVRRLREGCRCAAGLSPAGVES